MTDHMQHDLCGIAMTPTVTRGSATMRMVHHMRSGRGTLHVVTVNPEILLRAHRDVCYRVAVAASGLRTIDGVGVLAALWWRYGIRAERVTGVDLVADVCTLAARERWHVHCALQLGGLSDAATVMHTLRTHYPHVTVTAHHYPIAEWSDDAHNTIPQDALTADVVLCAFGAPRQDYFLQQLAARDGRRIVIGVGGTFDFMTGAVRRAPRRMRRAGMEWLWRMVVQPLRVVRIVRATIIFPLVILFHRDADDARAIGQNAQRSV